MFLVHAWFTLQIYQVSLCQWSQTFQQEYYFIDEANRTITQPMTLSQNEMKFGLVLQPGSDFNMIFSVTCQSLENYSLENGRKKCYSCDPCPRSVFIVSSQGPGDAQVNVINLNAASSYMVDPLTYVIHFYP
jgi:hypothetical protein